MLYKEAVWHLVIANGGVFADISPQEYDQYVDLENKDYNYRYNFDQKLVSYYGARIGDMSLEKTKEAWEGLVLYGMDYDASSDPAEYTGSGFKDTEASSQYRIKTLFGKMILKGNEQDLPLEYVWGVQLAEDFGFGSLIQTLAQFPRNADEAIEHCAKRLDSDQLKKYPDHFVYKCSMT